MQTPTEKYFLGDDFFATNPRASKEVLLGDLGKYHFMFPTFFYQSRVMSAAFLCDLRAAEKLLPDSLRPLTIIPGKSVIVFTCYEHLNLAEMDPYCEAVISIPAVKQGGIRWPLIPLLMEEKFSSFGHYVYHMPVDSALNQARGEHIWGLPKVISEINFSTNPKNAECEVRQDGEILFHLSTRTIGKEVLLNRKMQIFSTLDGCLHTTRNHIKASMQINKSLTKNNFSHVELGDHPIARKLQSLGPLKSCMESRYSNNLQSILHFPAEKCI